MYVFSEQGVKDGLTHGRWIEGSLGGLWTLCQWVFETWWMGALVFIELRSQSLASSNNTPRLLDRIALLIGESKSASIKGGFKHVELGDHVDDFWSHPACCVTWPFKRNVSTMLAYLTRYCDEVCKQRQWLSTAFNQLCKVRISVPFNGHELPSWPNGTRQRTPKRDARVELHEGKCLSNGVRFIEIHKTLMKSDDIDTQFITNLTHHGVWTAAKLEHPVVTV